MTTSIIYGHTARAPFLYLVTTPSLTAHADSYASADRLLSYTIDTGQGLAPAVTAGPYDDLPTDAPGGDDPDTGPHERTPILADYALELLKAAAIVAAHELGEGPKLWWEVQS